MKCPKCKYDLRGVDQRRCPECGCSPYAVFADRAERRHKCRVVFRAVSFWGLMLVLAGGLWFMVHLANEDERRRRGARQPQQQQTQQNQSPPATTPTPGAGQPQSGP